MADDSRPKGGSGVTPLQKRITGEKGGRNASASKAKHKRTQMSRPNDFTTMLENTVDAWASSNDDSAVEDIRKILADVRKQYDEVHAEAEKKEMDLQQLREDIKLQESLTKSESDTRTDDATVSVQKQLDEKLEAIQEATTNQKVYKHMVERITKEQAVVMQKMRQMESHLARKTIETNGKLEASRKLHQEKVRCVTDLEVMEDDVNFERNMRDGAVNGMMGTLKAKKNAIKRRADFERWRHEVALEAANEAFNASAGRLRKIWAIEKLAGNSLQKIIFEQVEKSQATEDGFQKIREVTGLTDVMDIVHKFLNRDVEHEQLKTAVKEAETKLESLREDFDRYKRETDGLTFNPQSAQCVRNIYREVEDHEGMLTKAMKEHEAARGRLQKSTMQIEHMKRWANRMAKSFQAFETLPQVEKTQDLLEFFAALQNALEKFIQHIQTQLTSGKLPRKNLLQAASKEYHEQARLLNDKDFIRSNCRVIRTDRPPSGGRQTEEDPQIQLQQDREKIKLESVGKLHEKIRQEAAEKEKKKR
eukprot:GEMP01029939.1.p1 GENE.GEMP01029939.1~~GEMP01029939.1.p1  ORF type:complete len:534 (+),score=135.23 GEMP01029939.1:111-1712(+)